MATRLTAIFDLVDNISAKLDNIASSGSSTISQWNSAETSANSAFASMERGGMQTAQACTTVATAAQSVGTAVDSSSNAIQTQEEMFVLCEEAARSLTQGMEASVGIQEDLEAAIANATGSTEEAEEAMRELEAAQQEAAAAMDYYDEVLTSGTDDLDELEGAAERAMHAAENLAEANGRAADATEELGEQADESGQTGVEAIQSVAQALAAAGIVKIVKEIGAAVMEASAQAAAFETSMAKLETISGSQYVDQLTTDINGLSRDMGTAASSLADVSYNAISAGSAVEDAVSTATAATKLATAGFTDATSSLSVLSTAMNAYGDAVGSATDVSDSLIMVQNLGVTTVADLSQQIGRAIAVASGYSVSLGNLESAYVSTTKAGINTAMSTSYISAMMTELGNAGSDVSGILVAQTGQSFGQLMNSGASLADVLGVLYDSVNGDTEAFMNLWGSATAGSAASAIVNQGLEQFNQNLQAIENSAGATEQAYSIMASTTEYAHQRMTNSSEQLAIAYGSALNPTLAQAYNAIANIQNAMAGFIERHPAVAKAITALGLGVGVVTVAVAGLSIAYSTVGMAAKEAFLAMNAAIGPAGWVIIGVTAAAAALTALVVATSDASESVNDFTATTLDQQEALSDLQSQYETACAEFGETSAEASLLRSQIDDLSASLEQNGKTVQQLADECDAVINKHNELMESFNSAGDAANEEELDNLALIAKLEQLASQTEITEGSQAAMVGIIDQLNSSIDGLNITYDDLISNQETTVATMREAAEAMAEQARQQAELENYIALIQQRSEEEAKLAEVTAEVEAAQRRADEAQEAYRQHMAEINEMDPTGMLAMGEAYGSYGQEVEDANRALELAQQEQNELTAAMGETDAAIASIEEKWGDAIDAQNDAAEAAMSYEEAVSIAYASVEDQLEELCIAYTDAYNAALDSFSGQFGLFDEAEANMEASVASAQAALDSQLAYWDSYGKNIEYLKNTSASDLGITQENYELLMSYVQSGSEEAAGLAYNMVAEIQNGNEEAVANLATTAGEVAARQQEVAASTADWQTNFNSTMADLVATMSQTVDDLNLDGEASDAAHATIDAYAASIAASQSAAVAAAQNVANAVTAALQAANATITVTVRQNGSVSLEHNATGTTDSADIFVAGEEGPELIIGRQHSTVFPADETQKIINAVDDEQERTYYEPPETFATPVPASDAGRSESGESVKRVVLELAGVGSIELTGAGGASRDDIADVLADRLKPALVQILTEEIFEEGDGSYEY